MKRLFVFAVCLTGAVVLQAQTKGGGLSADMLKDIVKENKQMPVSDAVANAVAANAIDDLAKNRQNAADFDTYFSIETPSQSITNQKQSGRCWMFSGFNVLRSNYTRQHGDSIQLEFSQAYLFFYDQLEKANLMLQGIVDTSTKPIDDQRVQFFFHYPLNDGGTFCGVADLTEKYGLVPKEVMPESFSSDNTSKARQLINSKLREYGLQLRDMVAKGKSQSSLNKAKVRMLAQVYRQGYMVCWRRKHQRGVQGHHQQPVAARQGGYYQYCQRGYRLLATDRKECLFRYDDGQCWHAHRQRSAHGNGCRHRCCWSHAGR